MVRLEELVYLGYQNAISIVIENINKCDDGLGSSCSMILTGFSNIVLVINASARLMSKDQGETIIETKQ